MAQMIAQASGLPFPPALSTLAAPELPLPPSSPLPVLFQIGGGRALYALPVKTILRMYLQYTGVRSTLETCSSN